MQTPTTPWRTGAFAATLLALPALIAAADLDSLVKNSPFGEPKTTVLAEKPSNLEFRGMYIDQGITYFSIYNSVTKLSAWVAQGEAPQGLVPVAVKSYDADNETIVIENAGQPIKLSLKQAIIGASPAAAPLLPANIVTANPIAQPQDQASSGRTFGNGQAPTAEQIQAFRDQMKARFNRGQNGGGGESGTPASTENGESKRDRGGFGRGGNPTDSSSAGGNSRSNKGGK